MNIPKIKTLFKASVFFCTISLLLVACGNKNEMTIKPKTTTIKGDLGIYFEVINRYYKIPITQNSLEQIIAVEIKRTNAAFPFDINNINPFGTNGGETHHVGFGIEFLGENGPIDIKNPTEGGIGGVYSSDDIKSIFKLKKGETGYVRWTVDKIDGLKSFQITSALSGSNDETITTTENSEIELSGTINNSYSVKMNLSIKGENVEGKYYYTKQNKDINLSGSNDNGNINLNEFTSDGKRTGSFQGILNGNSFIGTWTDADNSNSFPFNLTVTNLPNTISNTTAYTSSTRSADWDKLLVDYEAYIDQYIKLFKKAQNGDNTALVEYPGLLEKAERLQHSLE